MAPPNKPLARLQWLFPLLSAFFAAGLVSACGGSVSHAGEQASASCKRTGPALASAGSGNAGGADDSELPGSSASSWQMVADADTRAFVMGVDAAEHVYVAGRVDSNRSDPGSESQVFVSKYDVDGSLLWSKQWNSQRLNLMGDIAVDSSGNFYLAYVARDPSEPESGRGYLGKYDPCGRAIWQQESATNRGIRLALDAGGNVYVAGIVARKSSADPPSYLAKYDASGRASWLTPWSASAPFISNIELDASGNIYIASNEPLISEPAQSPSPRLLYQFDKTGTLVWSRQLGAPPLDSIGSIALDHSGNLYVAGTSFRSLPDDMTLHGGVMRKYDAAGEQLWTRQLDHSLYDVELRSIRLDVEGNPYVAGYVDGPLESSDPEGAQVGFVRKYAADGSENWVERCSADARCRFDALAVAASGNVYGAGVVHVSERDSDSALVAKFAAR